VWLPAGNQAEEVVAAVHRDRLTAADLAGVVGLLAAASARTQQESLLIQPRRALRQACSESGRAWNP
jgi:hypothetical protein